MKKLILGTILTMTMMLTTSTSAKAVTLQEFNSQLAKSSTVMRKEMDKLADMLGSLSKEDIDKLENTEMAPGTGVSPADLIINAGDEIYNGLEIFNVYTEKVNKAK